MGLPPGFAFLLQSHYPMRRFDIPITLVGAVVTRAGQTTVNSKNGPQTGRCPHDEQGSALPWPL
jgi:hypothetical protein